MSSKKRPRVPSGQKDIRNFLCPSPSGAVKEPTQAKPDDVRVCVCPELSCTTRTNIFYGGKNKCEVAILSRV